MSTRISSSSGMARPAATTAMLHQQQPLFMYLFHLLIVIFLLMSSSCANIVNYEGDQVLSVRLRAEDNDVQQAIRLLAPIVGQVDVWREYDPHTSSFDVRVARKHMDEVTSVLQTHRYDVSVMINDVGKLIRKQQSDSERIGRTRRAVNKNDDQIKISYIRYNEILEWAERTAKVYDDIIKLHNIGMSTEGRPMVVIQLGKPGTGGGKSKPRVWIDGGIHAREWIAPSSVIYVLCRLLVGYEREPELRDLVEKLDIFFLPVLNPDGYEYTHTADRLWRKNRRPIPNTTCIGVDLNRNWNFHWGTGIPDTDPCSLLFMGTEPESEIEVKNVARFVEQGSFSAFLTYHSYSQFFLTRWDYDSILPSDHAVLLDLALDAAGAMSRTHGQFYEAGTASQLLYKFGGGSPDWARGVANVTYSYLIELRDRGFYGFLLPEDQILATGEEVWEGVRVILNQVRHDRYGSGQEFNDTYYDFLQEEDFLFRLTKTFPAKWQGVYDYAGWSLAHSSTPVANCCCLYVLLLSLISSLHASLSLALFAN